MHPALTDLTLYIYGFSRDAIFPQISLSFTKEIKNANHNVHEPHFKINPQIKI